MKLLGLTSLGTISTAVLSLLLLAGAPVYAQEQHDQEEKQAQPEEKRPEQEKSIKPEEKSAQQDKNTKQEGKNAQQQDKNNGQEQKSAQQHTPQEQRAGGNGGGRIPDDRYRANFGREHTFRVSQGDYGNRRFQYGGYWFGFVGVWPSNWLYTQNVYVIDINGVYYLCNPVYPGVNIALSVTL